MKVGLLTAYDWSGLYIDGKLVLENDTLDLPTVLTKLGIDFEQVQLDELDDGRCPPEWMEEWKK